MPGGLPVGAPGAPGSSGTPGNPGSTAAVGPTPGPPPSAPAAGTAGGSNAAPEPGAGPAPAATAGGPIASAPAAAATAPESQEHPVLAEPAPSGTAPLPAADPSGRCSLSLGSKPWADVWIDGRRVGLTPLTDLPVACGAHEVVFTSTDLGVERRLSVNVQPGDRTRRIVDLEAPQAAAGDSTVAPAAAARAARPECRLSLGSRPWSEVWIDGRRAGVTPLVSVAVRCGRHDVLFVSREANVERRETIFVSEGQNVKRIVTLVEGE